VRPLALLLPLTLAVSGAAPAEDLDRRELVVLPEMMQQHMLANMRDHLRAIAQIQDALADGQFDVAKNVAEKRLGMSSLASHGASHMAPYMPDAMRAIGSQMHRAASQFALIAEETSVDRDLSRALKALAAVTAQCNSCHAAYRIR
jgi:cytochrome c556